MILPSFRFSRKQLKLCGGDGFVRFDENTRNGVKTKREKLVAPVSGNDFPLNSLLAGKARKEFPL